MVGIGEKVQHIYYALEKMCESRELGKYILWLLHYTVCVNFSFNTRFQFSKQFLMAGNNTNGQPIAAYWRSGEHSKLQAPTHFVHFNPGKLQPKDDVY